MTELLPLSRRDLARLAVAGAMLAACPVRAGAARPVVGFHNDAPWLDPTGRDRPYRPPRGPGPSAPDCESLMRLGHFL